MLALYRGPVVVVTGDALVDVDYHQFYLDAGGDISWSGETSTGLVEPLGQGAVVITGVASGRVRCAYAGYSRGLAPAADVDDWEDMVEILVRVGSQGLHIAGWGGMSFEEADLATEGPGVYVVRCSARNREAHCDEAVEVAEEEFLIEVWPAPADADTSPRTLRRSGPVDRAGSKPPGPQAADSAENGAVDDEYRKNREAELRNFGIPESEWTPDLFVEAEEADIQAMDDEEGSATVDIHSD